MSVDVECARGDGVKCSVFNSERRIRARRDAFWPPRPSPEPVEGSFQGAAQLQGIASAYDQGNFELIVFPSGAFADDPDQLLAPHTPGSPQNWSRFSNPGIEDLFARQARTIDPTERRKLCIELQKIVLENAYYMPGLWATRNVVHWAKVKNYVAPPSIFTNQKLQDIWLSED